MTVYRLIHHEKGLDITITHTQIIERLRQENRQTKPCPWCKKKNIIPYVEGGFFYMLCCDCLSHGPMISDYIDPLGLCETSWIVALKRCHDYWNSRD